ncbi:MAG: glucose-6-phosphate dehydrogenase [Parcubacteria group bacterium]|nr:glucose-6-phosphate dehydrogenase [Parcubacteria group bacterium]MCR4343021.1 glucose-6-phosphate dehydrogenase [Patescibacteria group bacterium]
MKIDETKNIPTVFVIFGATGDLMKKKIAPALFNLYRKDRLPKLFKVVGVSRAVLSDDDFRNRVGEILRSHGVKEDYIYHSFLSVFSFKTGQFNDEDNYKNIAKYLLDIDISWGICSNKLFYLSVPPVNYEMILKNLASSGLTLPCSPAEGWTRVLVEKPFGKDSETAKDLDNLLGRLFREEQIYRIDHYLAKEMLQNILTFRFSNNLFEDSWHKDFIEKIEIRLLEKVGAEERGEFYDGIGALRDVGQNHLLQMLALVTMDSPLNFDSSSIRLKRFDVLKTLKILSTEDIKNYSYKAQYEGYRDIKGVKPDSETETYFKILFYLDSSRFGGVPVIMESGKRMKEQIKEIIVTFKHKTPCLCPPGIHFKNRIIFAVEPEEKISIEFWSKKPGLDMEMEKRTLDFIYRRNGERAQYVEEYEKLLLDCILGDQTLFVSTDEVQSMWRFTDVILDAWHSNIVPLKFYSPDTEEAREDSDYIDKMISVDNL